VSGVAVVTGSARGLGEAIARTLARRGHSLLLVDRDPSVGETADSLRAGGAEVTSVVADLSDPHGPALVRAAVREMSGTADVLVNNAGVTKDARLAKMTVGDFRGVIEVNLLAAMRLTAALDAVLRDGGSVINISSRAALGNFGQVNYVASKAGIVGFTRALALSWAPRIRVNAVAPGLIDSVMSRAMPAEVLDRLVAKIPAGRVGQANDVAQAVAFLAGADSGYITGQVLSVCGGRSIAP
jgi:3-oxoacyl-[acyl-carrier protein] reductase